MPTARNFFNKREQQLIVNAIARAEQSTSGEIRLHLENFCFGNEVRRARRVFSKLKMEETKERNGILIYMAVQSRKLAIIGDEGIHRKLGDAFWSQLVKELIEGIKKDRRADALADCILKCGEQLGTFFPRSSNDINELSNNISFQ